MKKGLRISTIILMIGCLLGLSLLLYPTVSEYWNSHFTTRVVSDYTEQVASIDFLEYKRMIDAAKQYNADLYAGGSQGSVSQELKDRYYDTLSIDSLGTMGYIDIPKLDIRLAIMHGTSSKVLESAVGHVDWSSLPVGGPSTHTVLSAHRGLPSAKLFTDLDRLREGDVFTLTILNETLTYEVDQIRTVIPEDVSELSIVGGKDYCTLVTCTPYGINTHRLLVRGHRIENLATFNTKIIAEAVVIDPIIVAPVVAFPFLFTLLMMVMFKKPKKKRTKEQLYAELIGASLAKNVDERTNPKKQKKKSAPKKAKKKKPTRIARPGQSTAHRRSIGKK